MTTLSVLICTYNRPELLHAALQALIVEAIEKPDEVVIVNGGDERADNVVAQFVDSSNIEINLVRTVNKNLATSRNVGLSHCHGDIVAMTDDDAEVFPDWVTQMKRIHGEHPEAGAVGGTIIGANSKHSLLSRLSDLVTFPTPNHEAYVRTLPGVNISYKHDVLRQVGQQDQTLFRGEDVDFNWRVIQVGYKILYHPDIKVLHHHRPTIKGFLNQHYMYGRAYYLVRRKWTEMYCVYPHQLKKPKDFLKAINFMAAAVYEPVQTAMRMSTWVDKIRAVPILMITSWGWRAGMMHEKWFLGRKHGAHRGKDSV